MKFPYGISDFNSIISDNFFYIDRTDRIPLIEDSGRQLLFLRPRRFGKSLLLSMLENYYDMARADQFEALFGHLAIGKNPTDRHNHYFVLKWDFSRVNAQGDAEQIKQFLFDYINGTIKDFVLSYKEYLTTQIDIHPHNALASFESLMTVVSQCSNKLYLLIDEYDNFANELMMGSGDKDLSAYKALLHGEGTVKTLFKVIKSASTGGELERVFITGVSPVVLSDITSGYNVAENISLDPDLNELCGFWESEIETTLEQIARQCEFPLEEVGKALSMMRIFYDGYCFSYGKKSLVYNPTLALYFMKHFQKRCEYPRTMLDSNLAMDRGKISYISHLPEGDKLIVDIVSENQPLSISVLADQFGVEDMMRGSKDRTFMASLLYYFGVLTMGGENVYGEVILKVPNLVIRKLYVEQLQALALPGPKDKDDAQRAAKALYQKGDIQPLCRFVETRYFKVFDNRDYAHVNELTVKTAFLTLLFDDTFYIMDSEKELDRGYADLTMIVRPDMRRYELLDILLEFKYVSLSDTKLTGEKARKMNTEELKVIPLVKQKLSESQEKLSHYRKSLKKKYGEIICLRTFSVVALGFERLICEGDM